MSSKTISVDQLKQSVGHHDPIQIVDVRSTSEFNAGHVPGAINIPMEQIEARLADLDTTRPIVLVCQSGQRADMACEWISHEVPQAAVLEGGTSAWESLGNPVVRSTKTRMDVNQQVRLVAGILILTGVTLGSLVHTGWYGLAGFVGAGLTFAGLTGLCPMAGLLGAMPWNKACPTGATR